ncbi:MAG: hypothetical protein AAF960_12870 [Bacteroidota bacterium]
MNVLFAQLASAKKTLSIFLVATFLIVGFSDDASAQRDRNRKDRTEDYFDESGVGSFRFWYGGGVGLNFGSGFNTSQFNFSLSPMVGYKLTPEFSIGPRIELAYSHIRVGGGNNVERFNFVDYGIGAFTRYKLFTQFFAHAEYQIESRSIAFTNGETDRVSFNNFFFGGGYTSGGQIGYEISVLWNFLEDTADLPLDYRIAFTYNF